jgi:hypothetical protein
MTTTKIASNGRTGPNEVRRLVLRAMLVAAATGGVLASTVYTALVKLGITGYPEDGGLGALVVYAVLATVLIAVGLMIAAPLWLLLHRLRVTRWWVATIVGSGLPLAGLFCLAVFDGAHHSRPSSTPVAEWVVIAGLTSAIGAAVGFVIWWIAYPQDRPSGPRWLGLCFAVAAISILAMNVAWSIAYGSHLDPSP